MKFPLAALMPVFLALGCPWFGVLMNTIRGSVLASPSITSCVSSVEPSSTTTTSRFFHDWFRTDFTAPGRYCPMLYVAITTLTNGWLIDYTLQIEKRYLPDVSWGILSTS